MPIQSSQSRRLEGKRCLITGGSGSLGRALCLAFAQAGAKVAFTFHKNEDEAANTLAQILALGGEAKQFQGNVSEAKHARACIDELVKDWGGLDILVNNAGIMQILPMAMLEEDDWDKMIDTCLKGPYIFSRAALRPMLRAKRGHILNIGSVAGERIVEVPVHYAAAKAGLHGMTRALAKEVGRYGIVVNALSPALLNGGLGLQAPQGRRDEYIAHCPLGRTGSMEETAAFVTWLVSDENSFMSGARLNFDGGL
jgi:NAD(P)-dependent dehydrogenase (short-subunit alcohol dehydrogenase family)